jgi:MerR family mercuric resistance operon transcriptional regulator
MQSTTFAVGQLARQANCKTETVHYYEKSGLMPKPPRSAGGHRIYDLEHAKRLKFIRRCRELGFSLEQIRTLLSFIDEPDHSCGEVKAVAIKQSTEVQEKINDLIRLKQALDTMVKQCKGTSYPIDKCPIIDALYT